MYLSTHLRLTVPTRWPWSRKRSGKTAISIQGAKLVIFFEQTGFQAVHVVPLSSYMQLKFQAHAAEFVVGLSEGCW
jgi:hypothetical protein